MFSEPMFLKTSHGTFLATDSDSNLIHIEASPELSPKLVKLQFMDDGEILDTGPLNGYKIIHIAGGISLKKGGYYMSAEPEYKNIVTNREKPQAWEIFVPQSEIVDEETRFRKRVLDLIEQKQPIKITCGCGPRPLSGFLNLDGVRFQYFNSDVLPEEVFVFPFADKAWNIPDNSVDYIYHEDFIEHITQLQQIQFLAETLRVLKDDCYHRVNTPDLIDSMRRHSDFKKGFIGVYTGELQWEHISIFTRMSLKEIAELVGYRHIIFTTKSHGVSKYAVEDLRPGADRCDILGNIYADLQK